MRKLTCAPATYLAILLSVVIAAGCSDDEGVDSDEDARRAYLGLDDSIAKSIALGFEGFNTAQSANIDPQATNGTVAGMLTVSGQVDQGNSPSNKGMRLNIGMVGYDDGDVVINEEGDTDHLLTQMAERVINIEALMGEATGDREIARSTSRETNKGSTSSGRGRSGTTDSETRA